MLRYAAYRVYEKLLKLEIDDHPSHIAVIQDGNRRYAKKRGEDPAKGHRYGADTTEEMLDWVCEQDIKQVTLYTFSTENFNRPDDELEELFDLIEKRLHELAEDERVHRNEINVKGIGEIDELPENVVEAIERVERVTEDYDEFQLNLALGYGGRRELLEATRDIMREVEKGELDPGEIDAETVSRNVYRDETLDVDLVIRTGGDERISNFLPWQAKGNESTVYFCAPYWPAFRKIDFLRAVRTYGNRRKNREERNANRAVSLLRRMGEQEMEDLTEIKEKVVQEYGPKVADEDVADTTSG